MPTHDERLREMLRRPLVVSQPAMEDARVRPDVVYKTIGAMQLSFDVYRPPSATTPTPGVIFISGDGPGLDDVTLHLMKQSGQYAGWGRLVAANGMIGVVTNHRSIHQPGRLFASLSAVAEDVADLLAFLQQHGGDYGIDASRLAIWTCSGGPPFALYAALKQRPDFIRCLVAYYGMLDLRNLLTAEDGAEMVELITEYSPAVQIQHDPERVPPMLVARAGLDDPQINQEVDSFVAEALRHNLALTLLNHPTGRHAFDVLDANERSREIIADTVTFLRRRLGGEAAQ